MNSISVGISNYDIIMNPHNVQYISSFLQLIQEKFPDVTLSPGWMVCYTLAC